MYLSRAPPGASEAVVSSALDGIAFRLTRWGCADAVLRGLAEGSKAGGPLLGADEGEGNDDAMAATTGPPWRRHNKYAEDIAAGSQPGLLQRL
jgi:hypothetical protein